MKFPVSSHCSTAISGILSAKMSVPRMVCSQYKIGLARSPENPVTKNFPVDPAFSLAR